MLYRIEDFRDGDYEECRLLGYKDPVCTSQETHYVSATEPSRLMLCKVEGFHSDDYEEYLLVGCDSMWVLLEPIFLRKFGPPSSGWKESAS
jgi:hypothetical protein